MKLLWTDSALADLESIRDYIARDSAVYAARFLGRLVEAVEILDRFPEMGAVVPEYRNVRQLVYRKYRVLYRVRGDAVEVLALVHGSRDLTSWERPPWDIA